MGSFPKTYNDPKNYTGTSEGLCHVISYLLFLKKLKRVSYQLNSKNKEHVLFCFVFKTTFKH